MKHWLNDQPFRSLLRNTSYLTIARLVAGLCSLTTIAFAGRGLGVELFGVLVLITSYTQSAIGLTKFQSWQLIVRYGGHGLAHGNPAELKAATGFAFALDMLSGIGGMIIAIAILPLIAHWAAIERQYLWLAAAYCTSMVTMASATPNGVLRTLKRFDLVSWSSTVTPISRAVLACAAFVTHSSLTIYLVIWYASDVAGNLYTWHLGWRELKRRGLFEGIKPSLKPALAAGAWRFAIYVNLTTGVATIWGPIARLLVGGLLGPASAALFRVASSLAESAQKPASLLADAFYPEIVRMDLASEKPWKLMWRGTAVASAVAALAIIVLVGGGKSVISWVFGKQFIGAYAPLVVLATIPLLGVLQFSADPDALRVRALRRSAPGEVIRERRLCS